MLKKIPASQVRDGMFVHEICGPWLNSPFWQKSFLLSGSSDLDKLLASPITHVWIDTDKGVSPLLDDAETKVFTADLSQSVLVDPPCPRIARVSHDQEVSRAATIVSDSKRAVISMFEEARMGKTVDTGQAMGLVAEISTSIMRNPGALIGLARLKTADDYTYMHSVAVCALMLALARQLNLNADQTQQAGVAGLLHDIGKMAIPSSILQKKGKLTEEEFGTVRKHPAAGVALLANAVGISDIVRDVCVHHHEKMDGTGYPHRLAGDAISLFARMGAICDVYDAITSTRPYKEGWCPAESLQRMASWTPNHLDPEIFQAFVKTIGIYPVGTLVSLQSGRLGVVVDQQIGKSLLQPMVKVFFSVKSNHYIAPTLIDLAEAGQPDKLITKENPTKYGLANIERFWAN